MRPAPCGGRAGSDGEGGSDDVISLLRCPDVALKAQKQQVASFSIARQPSAIIINPYRYQYKMGSLLFG